MVLIRKWCFPRGKEEGFPKAEAFGMPADLSRAQGVVWGLEIRLLPTLEEGFNSKLSPHPVLITSEMEGSSAHLTQPNLQSISSDTYQSTQRTKETKPLTSLLKTKAGT